MVSSLGKALLLLSTSVLLASLWKMYPLTQPSQIRLAMMQMHSLMSSVPPLLRTAFSMSSRSSLLETMVARYLTRLRQMMMRMRSMSRQMPRLSHTFWYFLLSYSQAVKSAVLMALMISTYSMNSLASAVLGGSQSLPRRILQGMRYFMSSLFCPLVRRLILRKHCSASMRFSLTSAYLPFWKRKLSMQRGWMSPQFLGEQIMRWICWQLWKVSRMDTCITSTSDRNYRLISSSRALAALQVCRVLNREFFILAAAALVGTFTSAVRKIFLVARTITSSGLASHIFISRISYSTFSVAFRLYMCFSKHYDHRPAALSSAKSRTSSTTRMKLGPIVGSVSIQRYELALMDQLFSETLEQFCVKQSSRSSLASLSPSRFQKAPCMVQTKSLAVLGAGQFSPGSLSIQFLIIVTSHYAMYIHSRSRAPTRLVSIKCDMAADFSASLGDLSHEGLASNGSCSNCSEINKPWFLTHWPVSLLITQAPVVNHE